MTSPTHSSTRSSTHSSGPGLAELDARLEGRVLWPGTEDYSATAPWSTGGGLPNLAATGDVAMVAARYDAATFARLGAIVATYDPHGVLVAGAPFRPG